MFRLGRLLSGGARGPGVFFIIPCVDIYEKIDLRVRNFNVPPQEVIMGWSYDSCYVQLVDICHIAFGIQLPMLLFVTIGVQNQEYNRVMQLISVDNQKNFFVGFYITF